jgi:hypothetical protein
MLAGDRQLFRRQLRIAAELRARTADKSRKPFQ